VRWRVVICEVWLEGRRCGVGGMMDKLLKSIALK
jgi:hypothetical protein